MRSVQAHSVELFERHGCADVTIDAVAKAAAISSSTIYRYFGTKEALILWDERDPVFVEVLGAQLDAAAPIDAFLTAATVAFAERDDLREFARRLKLVYGEPSLWAAAAAADRIHRNELAAAFANADGRTVASRSDALSAAVCLSALDIAFESWATGPSKVRLAKGSLGEIIASTFSPLTGDQPT